MSIRFSRYLRQRVREGIVAVFHELHPVPLYLPEKEWVSIKGVADLPEGMSVELRQRRLIVSDDKDDVLEYQRAVTELRHKLSRPNILYLKLADDCNYACSYCPCAESIVGIRLSLVDALSGVRLWRSHLADYPGSDLNPYVIFYGGEPLLNRSVFLGALQEVGCMIAREELPKNTKLMLATNGDLLDDELIEACAKWGVEVAIGLDGLPGLEEMLRLDRQGHPTFDRSVAIIRRLIECGIVVTVSVSITPANLERLADVPVFLESLGVNRFGFNFLKGCWVAKMFPGVPREEYYLRASRAIIGSFRRHARTGYEYQMARKVAAFESQEFFPVDCACYGNQLVIRADGRVAHCPFQDETYGSVLDLQESFRIQNQPQVRELQGRHMLLHPESERRDFLALSGAGCAWSSHEATGDSMSEDSASSIFAREVFDELIWSKLERKP
ncbi:MAG: radical SAM protein [Patescibacteria group bacterium]|nr:radical SAM protein [Patescibacteria group bacterium]